MCKRKKLNFAGRKGSAKTNNVTSSLAAEYDEQAVNALSSSIVPPSSPDTTTPTLNTQETSEKNIGDIFPDFKINEVILPQGERNVSEKIDEDSKELNSPKEQNSIESDRDYRKITNDIITQTSEQLKTHTKDKRPLRITLMIFVIALLTLQFIALIAILFTNQKWALRISDQIINTYIVSLFVETLTGLFIMIRFAFDSKQEVKLIEILNNIVEHFKKYDDK